MQKINVTPPANAVLPIPPIDYDVGYMTNLIRILNLYFQQLNNPGLVQGFSLRLSDGDVDNDVIIDTTAYNDYTRFLCTELPTTPSLSLSLNNVTITSNGSTSISVPVTTVNSLEAWQLWDNNGAINIVQG